MRKIFLLGFILVILSGLLGVWSIYGAILLFVEGHGQSYGEWLDTGKMPMWRGVVSAGLFNNLPAWLVGFAVAFMGMFFLWRSARLLRSLLREQAKERLMTQILGVARSRQRVE